LSETKQPLFDEHPGLSLKIRKIYDYMFHGFPFHTDRLDYEEYWTRVSQGYRPVSIAKQKMIASMIEEGSSVLDVGCGGGNLLQYLVEKKKIKPFGVDVAVKADELTRKRGIEAQVADLTKDGFTLPQTYDYVVISEVLEHLPNPEQLMFKLKGKVNKFIIITVPNTGFIGERLRMLFGRFPKQWVLHPSEHLRFWTVADFIYWCGQLGFKVVSYRGMLDEFYDIKIKVWKFWPRLFARYVLYKIAER